MIYIPPSIDQDWESESKNVTDEKDSADQNKTAPKTYMVSLANIADSRANVKLSGTDQQFPIPKGATASVTIKGGEDDYTFSAKPGKGTDKKLQINGQDEYTVKAADMPASLVVHNEGEHSFVFM